MESTTDVDIFGSARMGYLVVGSQKIGEWKRFATEAIGLHLAYESPLQLAFRMDDHARRLIIENDAAEDVVSIGWQLDSESVLQVILDRLASKGVKVEFVDDERAQGRGVASFYRFAGPKGFLLELFTEPIIDESPLDMLAGGFITGAAGMGHISIMSREPQRNIQFWQELFNARVSDIIELEAGNKSVIDVTFLRMNERHHSVAIAATKGLQLDLYRTRIQHLNIEVSTLDDLTMAYERTKKLGYKLARGIGRHPNDKELSFYVHTPSGFELEIGWDALTVDEDSWREGMTYSIMSNWGHEIPGRFSSDLSLSHLVRGAMSLRKTEYLPW